MAINLYNMGTIERTRVIRPSSRKDKSTYKVDIERRQEKDSLHLTVTHENDCNFRKEYYFSENQLLGKKSIHFKWNGNDIVWTDGIVPIRIVK